MQPRPRINRHLPIRRPILKPAPTRTRPRRPLQKQIRMLAKLTRHPLARRQRLDPLDLRLRHHVEHVLRPALDQRHEAAVPERPIRSAEAEVVGEARDRDAQVRGDAVGPAPLVAQVDAVRADEREAWLPRCVEARGADDHVDVVGKAFVVGEPGRRDLPDGVGEDGGVGCDERFEVAGSGRWTSAAWVEVFGDDFVAEAWVALELSGHFIV